MTNPYDPDFDFPYNAGTPTTGASSNSPINLNLGQVPDIEDPILARAVLDIYNALEVLQTFQGNLTSATGDYITDLNDLTARVVIAEADIVTNAGNITTNTGNIATNAGNITTNASAITAIQLEIDAIDLILIDFEARINALENP
jgi:hypothetical protein